VSGISTGLELCPVCWVMAHTFRNEEGIEVMFWHRRPAVPRGNTDGCEGSHQPAKLAVEQALARVGNAGGGSRRDRGGS
jgi:hypothetical protein